MVKSAKIVTLLMMAFIASVTPNRIEAAPTTGDIETFVVFGQQLFEIADWTNSVETVERIPNVHKPTDFDEWHTRTKPKLVANFGRFQNGSRELLREISLNDPGIELLYGIVVGGSSMDYVRTALGKPKKESDHVLFYELPDESYQRTVTFEFSNNVLAGIRWFYEID